MDGLGEALKSPNRSTSAVLAGAWGGGAGAGAEEKSPKSAKAGAGAGAGAGADEKSPKSAKAGAGGGGAGFGGAGFGAGAEYEELSIGGAEYSFVGAGLVGGVGVPFLTLSRRSSCC